MRNVPRYILFIALGILAAGSLYFFTNLNPYRDVPLANIQRLSAGERSWYEAGILDYDISVQIAFSTERRINDLEVRQGKVTVARSARWEDATEDWGPFRDMEEQEFRFYTVPGLLETVRSAMQNEEVPRTEIRVQFEDSPPIPSLIYLGEILQDGVVVDTTALLIEILSFEIAQQ